MDKLFHLILFVKDKALHLLFPFPTLENTKDVAKADVFGSPDKSR
jgi:hypothetical protein